nr:hypothetical protein [Tanacetum cinerariifolium]
MAPPIRTDDQILPRIRWVPNRKRNCYLDLEKSQGNPIYKTAMDLLKNTNFFRAFTASSTIPLIYIQQFWDTIQYDKKAGCYRCQLDEQWFVLTKDTLREALQITPVNNNQAFVAPPTSKGLINFVNELGYPKLVKNLSNVVTNDLFKPGRALLTIINLCLAGKTSGFERPRAPVLQILWGIVKQANIDYAERNWEEFIQSIHTFIEGKWNLGGTSFTQDLTLRSTSNEEPVLGYLKFSAKGTKREVFRMPIPGCLITAKIQEASYYQEYLAKEKKRNQATKTSDKPPKAKKSKYGLISKKRTLKNVAALKAEDVPTMEPQVATEDTDLQKALEESMKTAYALPRGQLPPVVIREPESGKYQPLPEVPGKGKAKVTEEQVTHDLLSLQKHKKTSLADQYIFERRVFEPTGSSKHDESPYALLGQSDSEEDSEKVVLGADEGGQDEGQDGPDPGSDAGAQNEGQAGSNLDETSKDQAGPDTGDAGAKVQSILSHVVHAGSDREHMDLDVADVSPQPSTEQLDEGYTATAYPKVQENLKLAVEEQQLDEGYTATAYPKVQENLKLAVEEHVLLEEPASSSRTLSSLQHLSKDISFGDLFFSERPLDADKNTETEVESIVNVPIQQAMSSISLMTSPIIDLTSRPESPKVH